MFYSDSYWRYYNADGNEEGKNKDPDKECPSSKHFGKDKHSVVDFLCLTAIPSKYNLFDMQSVFYKLPLICMA